MPCSQDATRALKDHIRPRAVYMKQVGDRILTIHYPSVEFAYQWMVPGLDAPGEIKQNRIPITDYIWRCTFESGDFGKQSSQARIWPSKVRLFFHFLICPVVSPIQQAVTSAHTKIGKARRTSHSETSRSNVILSDSTSLALVRTMKCTLLKEFIRLRAYSNLSI